MPNLRRMTNRRLGEILLHGGMLTAEQLEEARVAEHVLIGKLLDGFDTMLSLEGAVVDDELFAQRAGLLAVLRRELTEVTRDPLEGLVLRCDDLVVGEEPINDARRVRLAAAVGGAGGGACLVVLIVLGLVRGAARGRRSAERQG